MTDTINSSLAPGTIKNRLSQASLYIKFMITYGFDYLAPQISELAMYYQFLGNSFSSPGTVKNHVSSAKAWVQLHLGDITNFGAQELSMMSKSLLEGSGHIPSPAAPLTSNDIRNICAYIDSTPNPHPAFKAAILLAFATFLRVSNVLSPSRSSWGGAHTLLAQEIEVANNGLLVTIRSTKTRRHGKPHILSVYPVADRSVCPVAAWQAYYLLIQPCPLGPAFMLNDNTPLTPGPVVKLMRSVLKKTGVPTSSRVSFHSLRRGGAQTAAQNGASQEQIMYHGTWKSTSGVEAYLRPDPRTVPAIIARTLAK